MNKSKLLYNLGDCKFPLLMFRVKEDEGKWGRVWELSYPLGVKVRGGGSMLASL